MTRLLALAALRFYGRHPWQLVLAIAGISLGVAVSVGVNLANDSARRAFESSTEILQGKTTHRLLPVGGALAEEVFVRLVKAGRATHAAPVLETRVRLDTAAAGYPLLGIDPIEESAFRGFAGFVPGRNSDLTRLMTVPGTVMLPDALARARGLAPGDVIDLAWKAQLRLCARFRKLAARGLNRNKIVVAVARELSGFVWALGQNIKPV